MPTETHLLNEAYSKVRQPKKVIKEDMDYTVDVALNEDELNFIINALVINGSNPKFPGRKASKELMDKLKRHLFYTRTPGASDADLVRPRTGNRLRDFPPTFNR